MGVSVVMPNIEAIVMEALKERIQKAALSVAADVPRMIKDMATLEGIDANGQPIQPKIPRPKKNPTNFPNLPLIQTGNMYDHDRWKATATDDGAVVTYSPPDYYPYVIEKRPWLTPDKMNADVRAQIDEQFRNAIKEGGE